jgi:hypothetical protein
VTATNGNGIFAKASGGYVSVNAGDVELGVEHRHHRAPDQRGRDRLRCGDRGHGLGRGRHRGDQSGTGATSIITNGPVTGTGGEGILATGNDLGGRQRGGHGERRDARAQPDRQVPAARAPSMVIGGDGFVGGTGDAVNIKNDGSGTVTVDIAGASSSAGGEGIVVGAIPRRAAASA